MQPDVKVALSSATSRLRVEESASFRSRLCKRLEWSCDGLWPSNELVILRGRLLEGCCSKCSTAHKAVRSIVCL